MRLQNWLSRLSAFSSPTSVRNRRAVKKHERGAINEYGEIQKLEQRLLLVPDIAITGGGFNIANNDFSPSTANRTFYGTIPVSSGSTIGTYTIRNVGNSALSLAIPSVPGSDFTLITPPSSVIPAFGQSTFRIRFDPVTAGTRQTTVTIPNNDPNENPFRFAIRGVGAVPEIAVIGQTGANIADNDNFPSTFDGTQFSNLPVVGGSQTKTFTIRNLGNANLSVGTISESSSHFTVITQPNATIVPGGSSVFRIRFDPALIGNHSTIVSFGNSDSNENPFNFRIQGLGLAPEVVVTGNGQNIVDGDTTPSGSDGTQFPSLPLLSSTFRTFVIRNIGNQTLNLGTPSTPGSGFTLASLPASFVPPGGSTSFTVRFRPVDGGAQTSTISFANNDLNENPFNFNVRGVGLGREATVTGAGSAVINDNDTTPSVSDGTNFGSLDIASPPIDQTFVVRNTGTSPLQMGQPMMSPSAGFSFLATSWGNINPGSSRSFTIRFDPNVAGTDSANVFFATNDANENPYNFRITGLGVTREIDVQGGGLSITDGDTTPSALDDTRFGGIPVVSGSILKTFTILNTGNVSLSVSAPVITGASDFSLDRAPDGTVGPGSSTSFDLLFDPGTAGPHLASVSIGNNDNDENPYTFSIQGFGLVPEITVSGNGQMIADGDMTPESADGTDFGSLDLLLGSALQDFVIENIGDSPLTVGIPVLTGDTSDFSITGLPTAPVLPGTQTTVQVTFDPTMEGVRNATLTIPNGDDDENPFDFALRGTGRALDFGDAPDSYLTTFGVNGARHRATGPTLGSVRDTESNAELPLDGSGDDVNSDDEDGLVSVSEIVRNGSFSVTVDAPSGGELDAFIDFDGSGTFDADEKLTGASVTLTPGLNTIFADAPADTVTTAGSLYSRFRISTAGGLSAFGPSIDGEVEDHLVAVEAPPTGAASDENVVDDDYAVLDPGTPIDGGIIGYNRFATLQRAIDVAADGGIVSVNPGTYPEAVSIVRDVTVNGQGTSPAGVVIDPPVSGDDGISIGAPAENVFLSSFRVTGADDGISATGGVNLTLSDIEAIDNSGDGIDLEGVGDVVLTNVVATGNDPGLFINGGASLTDTDGVYSGNADHGIQVIDIAGDVTLTRTTLEDNDADNNGTGDGLNATDGADGDSTAIGGNLIVRGAIARDTDAAGTTVHQQNGVFVEHLTGDATFEDSTGTVQSVTVTGNRTGGVHIATVGGSSSFTDGEYSDNGVSTSIGSGIKLNSQLPAATATFADVTANRNASRGIWIIGFPGGAAFDGVTANENSEGVIVVMGGDVEVKGDFNASHNSGTGLRLGTSGHVTVEEAEMTGNGLDGINIIGAGDIVVSGVDADGNSRFGFLASNASSVVIDGGVFSGISTTLVAGAVILESNDVISTDTVSIAAFGDIHMKSGLDAGSSTVWIAANFNSTGGEDFIQEPGAFVRSTNETDSAITVITRGGDAILSELTAGTTSGRVNVDTGAGSVTDSDASGANNITAQDLIIRGQGGVGTSADPIETTVSNIEGAGGAGGFHVVNDGALNIGDIQLLTVGVVATTGDIEITAASPLTISENVTAGGDITLTAGDSAGGGDNLTLKTTISVTSTDNDVNLRAGDDMTLEDSSTVSAASGKVSLLGDFGNVDPGIGSTMNLFGTIISSDQAIVTGDIDDDTINVDPGVGHTIDSILLDGAAGNDTYNVQYGRLTGGASAIDIADSGGGTDSAVLVGLSGDELITAHNNDANGVDPQTGGFVENNTEGERVNYSETLEHITLKGVGGNDLFDVQPSQTAEFLVDGGDPSWGDPNVPPGDTLDFDSLGNTFSIVGKTIFTDGGDPDAFLGVTFVNIESMPLTPIGTGDPISFDFDHSNTASSVATSPTQPGYVSVARDTLYAGGLGFGWQSEVDSFERDDSFYSGPFADLIRDGHYFDSNQTFTIDLPNGWYSVDVTLGNPYTSVTDQNIVNGDSGGVLSTGVTNEPGESTQTDFAVEVKDGSLDLEFITALSHPSIFSINGLAIRPANLLTMGINTTGVGALPSDGVTTDSFRLYEAPPNSYVTVSSTLATVMNEDVDSEMDGIQVLTDDMGEADILLRRPTGMGTTYVKFVDVNGQGLGCSAIDYVLPDSRNIDFNHVNFTSADGSSPTQAPVATAFSVDGFLGVLPTEMYDAAVGFGWLESPSSFDDGDLNVINASDEVIGIGDLSDLARDGAQDQIAQTFRVDLPNGDYEALLTIGDERDHDGFSLDVNGVNIIASLDTVAQDHDLVPFEFSVTGGKAEFSFDDVVGRAHWVVNGLQIRPKADVVPFVFTPDIGDVPADGLTQVTIKATTTLADGELVTVTSSHGTLITEDLNPEIEGVQVEVAGGMIVYDVVAPGTPAIPTLSATSLDGLHYTSQTESTYLDFVLADARRFDFNHTNTPGAAALSPTAAGFIPVLRTDTDPSTGFGWLTPPNSDDTGVPNEGDNNPIYNAFGVITTDLYRDSHFGHAVLGSRTFRVEVDSAKTYDGTVYLGSQRLDASTTVTVEGVAVPLSADTEAKAFAVLPYVGAMDLNADGFVDFEISNAAGISPFWSALGIDIADSGVGVPLPAPVVGAERGTGYSVDPIEPEELATVVEIAKAAWEEQGLTQDELDLLDTVEFVIRDLGSNGALGLTTPLHQVIIDDDGAGFGWSDQLDKVNGDRYDLLTVIGHELGHVLGRADLDPTTNDGELMSTYLHRGDRHDDLNGVDGFFTIALDDALNI